MKKKTSNIRYVGLDLSINFLSYCKTKFPDDEFIIGSAEQIPIRNKSIDFVICKDLLEHLLNGYQKALNEMIRVSSKKVVVSWFLPPRDEPTKIGIIYPYNNFLHKIYVFLFTLFVGKIQYNIYNKKDLLDTISRIGLDVIHITKIGMNFNRDPCEVWELASSSCELNNEN